MRRISRHLGRLLMATAVLHMLVGVLIFAKPLVDIGRAGVFNAVDPHYDRYAAFWFLTFGVLIFMLGQLIHWTLRRTGTLPASLGWSLLGLSIAGVILMPTSGFWLAIPQALLAVGVARQGGAVTVVGSHNAAVATSTRA